MSTDLEGVIKMSGVTFDNTGRHVPVLIFRSASGRTEISTRPGGGLRIHVRGRAEDMAEDRSSYVDDWTGVDVDLLAAALRRPAP